MCQANTTTLPQITMFSLNLLQFYIYRENNWQNVPGNLFRNNNITKQNISRFGFQECVHLIIFEFTYSTQYTFIICTNKCYFILSFTGLGLRSGILSLHAFQVFKESRLKAGNITKWLVVFLSQLIL